MQEACAVLTPCECTNVNAGVCGEPAGHAGGRVECSADLRGEKQGQAAQVGRSA